MSSTTDLYPNDSLKIKEDDKFFSRLLSKESSMANPSFRVYYGVASGAVPFVWESQPGTPKKSVTTLTLPPLTPPPSYHSTTKSRSCTKKSAKPATLIQAILPWFTMKKTHPFSLSSPSVSSTSSLSPMASHRRNWSTFSFLESEEGSPTSGARQGTARRAWGCY